MMVIVQKIKEKSSYTVSSDLRSFAGIVPRTYKGAVLI